MQISVISLPPADAPSSPALRFLGDDCHPAAFLDEAEGMAREDDARHPRPLDRRLACRCVRVVDLGHGLAGAYPLPEVGDGLEDARGACLDVVPIAQRLGFAAAAAPEPAGRL